MSATADCSFCRRAAAAEPPTGGWIDRDELVGTFLLPGCEIPGWVCVQTNEHVEGWAALDAAHSAAVAAAIGRVSRALAAVTGESRVYTYAMGERFPHFHQMVGPPPTAVPAADRGAPLLARVAARDPALADRDAALHLAARLGEAIGSRPGDRTENEHHR